MSQLSRWVGGREGSAIALGGARWSLTDVPDEDAAVRTVHAALDAGVTFFDTALAYTTPTEPAHNEELLARALRSHPQGGDIVLATKGGHLRDPRGGFPIDARPQTLVRHCRESAARLGVDQLDLYYLHWPDPAVPLADSVGALGKLRDEGLIGMVGICNVTLEQVLEAQAVTRIDAVQNTFSPLNSGDRQVLAHCERAGIAYFAYSPFGGPAGAKSMTERLPGFARAAQRRGVAVHEIVVAWLLAQSDAIIPIIGAGRPQSIEAAVRGAGLQLDDDELRSLDEAVAA